jgi:DNA-3-methyladenine glycosylase II
MKSDAADALARERMDVLPPRDFGVREGYGVLKSLLERPTPATLREPAQAS